MKNDFSDPCPHCGFELDDGDIIDRLLATGHYKTKREVAKAAKNYGYDKKEPSTTRSSKRLGIYNRELDTIVGTICPKCRVILCKRDT